MYRQFKKWFQDKVGIGENRDRLDFVEKKIHMNHQLIRHLIPEVFEWDSTRYPVTVFQDDKSLANIYKPIHKNDIMFLGNLLSSGDVLDALNIYFSLGKSTAELVTQIIAEENKTISSFLDFGAGYGRVSRFLPHMLGNEVDFYASDIKEEAVRFNEKHLRFKPIVHSQDAKSFPTNQSFDLIFAGSVFTHLPETPTHEWLDALSTVLSKQGLLIFSTRPHDNNALGGRDFVFIPSSEDSAFNLTEDHIKDDASYGTTYFSDSLLSQMMASRNLAYRVVSNGFGGTQDLVICWHKS